MTHHPFDHRALPSRRGPCTAPRAACLLLLFTLFAAPSVLTAAEPTRPNVVVFLIDDLGRNDLGCYGSKYHRTPHLDRMAAEGLRFTAAYAACPVCSPTRAALLTGQYPARLHLTDWLPGQPDRPHHKVVRPNFRRELALEAETLAEALKTAGYATAHVGKWHLGGSEGFGPERQGFDINIAGDQTGTPLSYFAPFKNRQGRFMPGLEQAPEGEYLTDRLTTEAEKILERHRDRPFFLYFAHYAVHTPLKAPDDRVARYKPGPAGQQGNPVYAAMVEAMDESVGRILRKLDELKLTERTLVVFTSDNGGLSVAEGPATPATTNAPLRDGKGYLYEGGIRAPLLVRWPGRVKPAAPSDPVCTIDLKPTILDLCGVRSAAPVDGISLATVLDGKPAPRREALFWHYPHYSNQGGRPGGAVRVGDLKLIEFYDSGRRELYHLKSDPGEHRNLAPSQPERVAELHARLDAWRRSVGAQAMTPNPTYRPNPPAADGSITLHARSAEVHGVQLCFEPAPHKNTLGFWTHASDWAEWEFTAEKPGKYAVEVLQGCGKGQGGSEVEVEAVGQKLRFVVEDTGHFQNFKSRTIGTVLVEKPGRHQLAVRPVTKAAAAVMDLRTVTLRPTP